MEPASAVMTVREVAVYLSVDEKTVYRLTTRRELPGFKVAGTWRFKKTDIDDWIEKRKAVTQRSGKRSGMAHE
jgi:excisionase family DNA binding protein